MILKSMTLFFGQKMKILKPTKLDVSLLYECPTCSSQHWIFSREAQTKGFIIVCECNTVFKPKVIDSFKIKYRKKKQTPTTENIEQKNVPVDWLTSCATMLESYGFTPSEAKSVLEQTYKKYLPNTQIELFKLSLQSLEITDV